MGVLGHFDTDISIVALYGGKCKNYNMGVFFRTDDNYETSGSCLDVARIDHSNAGTFSLLVARSGAKLEKTSLSTDGSKVPAFCYGQFWQLVEGGERFVIICLLEVVV